MAVVGEVSGAMTVRAPSPRSPRRYASARIARRRQRIVQETLRLVGESGADGFTLKELGRRAQVSVTTIYNIFGDKEGLLAHALREFHAGVKLTFPARASDLAGFLETVRGTTEVVIANRAYALALADLYFSRSLSTGLFEVIRGIPLTFLSHWLWLAESQNFMGSPADAEMAARSFANLEWGCIKDWGAGRIRDEELTSVRQRNFLIVAMAVGSGGIRQSAARLTAKLSDPA